MADSDEDDLRSSPPDTLSRSLVHPGRPSPGSPSTSVSIDQDLSEGTPDFRLLSSLASTNNTKYAGSTASNVPAAASATASIPRRGEKDFEPNPTKSQQRALEASRQAMHEALSVERVHAPKNWVVGYFTGALGGETGGQRGMGKEDRRLRGCVVRIDQPRGVHFRTMGVSDRANRVWLLPEEALYLIERGSLDIRWAVPGAGNGEGARASSSDEGWEQGEEEEEDDAPSLSDLPMSLQGAYATLISDEDLPLARYTVFAGLRRSGYTVIRAPTWDNSLATKSGRQHDGSSRHLPTEAHAQSTVASAPAHSSLFSLFNWRSLRTFLTTILHFLLLRPSPYQRQRNSCASLGPLVAPGLYRSYADIYRALTLIPFHDPLSKPAYLSLPTATPSSTPASQSQVTTPSTSTLLPFRTCYHVYKPSTPYRKACPPPPDFHLAVVDARSHPIIPSLTEIGTLLEEMPIHDPSEDEKLKKGRPEMRLKAGTRDVVLAVVDGGVVSFLRMAETGSGRERIYEDKVQRGGAKGGRRGRGGRGGRGGGRGRGRGQ